MAKLTGLQIFKHLPGGKKEAEANCKKCGFPTCMAFAMKLAKGETSIDKCEYVTDELKALFEESSQLQQQEVVFGSPQNQAKTGNETVMFRHDKKFVNQTCLAIKINSSDKNFDEKLDKIINYSVERVGEDLKATAAAIFDTDGSFEEKAGKALNIGVPVILSSSSIEKISSILENSGENKPLVFIENANIEQLIKISEKYAVPFVIFADSVEELVKISSVAAEKDIKNVVLNLKNQSQQNLVENLTYIRRSAIEDKFKPLGYPVLITMDDINGLSDNPVEQSIWVSVLLCKYANIILLNDFDEAVVYALLTLRQNIYTDPEKPLQIDAKVYPVGEPDENSPVIVTTNFALTYFTVVGEIEASNIPAYLVITPSDGMSVLTAWSADKFNGEIIAKAFKEFDVNSLVNHRKVIIPGYVSSLKEEIEDEMPDWEVVIGANEATDIVDFLRAYQKNN